MAKLGSKNRPAVVRVQTTERAQEILELCDEHDWQVIVGIEEDKPEDISDVKRLLNPETKDLPRPISLPSVPKTGRNAPCPCGSGLKYKKCCGQVQT
ncbi:MAG: zinc chelation protein SecC [Deltaproteobacteria bacterium]|nr:zinc chelation protein SecC [Deltaproteobacteria bacterium]MBM4287938.1 zinc chelation protein SecC [Deltaproteobacteria bacterium]